jgi:hypothetical protein
MTDTLLYTDQLSVISADNLLVTPPGGTQATLSGLVNGGTVDAGSGLLNFGSVTPAGSNAATAPVITGIVTEIGTGASTTGVALPPTAIIPPGDSVLLINAGTAAVHVYGGAYTIDGIAAATGVILTNGTSCFFTPISATAIISGPKGGVSA